MDRPGFKHTLIAAFLLAIFFIQATVIAYKKNNTWDESAHILAGYAYLNKGMDYLSPLNHPAFGRLITAVFPSILLDLDFNETVRPEKKPDSDFFPYSVDFIYKNKTKADTILYLARLANILLGILLGIYIYVWAVELWGANGGLFSLFLYALCPNILAHSSLATTDLPITAFFFISSFYLYKIAFNGTTARRVILAALFMALAFTSKHTAFLLVPLSFASFILSSKKDSVKKSAGFFAVMFVLVCVFIWAVYAFRYHSPSLDYEQPDWSIFAGSSYIRLFDFLRLIRFLPEAYLYGVAGVIMGAGSGKAAYLMGAYSNTGWWYYFPVAFLIKTPIPVIIFSTAALLWGLRKDETGMKLLALIVPALLVFAAMSMQKVNIGLRHILPVYPFLFAIAGFVPSIKTESIKLARVVFYACFAWYIYAAASIFPHQLAYFNEIAGGPENGHKFLVDSNLDWGQDLKGLKKYMDERGIKEIKLAYFGINDPANFGIKYEYLPSYVILNPVDVKDEVKLKGWFAISATMLEGVYLADPDFYAVFRSIQPVDRIGYSIYVYYLGEGP